MYLLSHIPQEDIASAPILMVELSPAGETARRTFFIRYPG